MSTVPAFPRIVTAMRLVFAFYLVAALVTPLSAPLSAQCTPVTQVPNGTISSGTVCYSNNTDLNAAGVVINGSASASFVAGQSVHLAPGFRATAGTAPTTFHAWVESLPSAVSVAPSTGAGLTRTFDWTVSSPAGIASISQVFALFNTAVSGANACYIRYDRASNTLFLANDAANGWLGGYPLGSSGQSSNAKCSINTQGASVTTSGNQLTLTVPVTFQPAFSGTKNNYLLVYNTEALNSGWQTVGSWTVGTSPPQQYSLTTSTSPAGAGSVSPPCPTGCQYPSGTQVQLTATPSAGYQFANFTGSVTGGSPASVTMDSNKNVTANFTQTTTNYSLTTAVSPSGGGTVTPSCPAGCSYSAGTAVTVMATPNAGYQFTGFSGSLTGGSPGYITMNSNKSVTASFAPSPGLTHRVTTVPSGLTITVDSVPCVTPCSFQWAVGTMHSIAAASQSGTPGTQHIFANWSDNGSPSHIVTAPSSTATFTASFTTQFYLTTVTNPANAGSISPGSGWYDSGTLVAATATANATYQFSGFAGAATGITVPSYFAMNAPKSLTANFVTQGTTLSPNLSEMAVLSLFVKRHQSLVAAGASPANGGLYGLPDNDVASVNTAVSSANQQLEQIQAQAWSYADGFAYMNARSTVLNNLKSQMRSGISSASWQNVDSYMNTALAPSITAVSLNGSTPPQPLPDGSGRCDPSATNCMFMWSEINFYNGGGTNHGLGARIESWVEGPNAKDFTATVSQVKESFTPPSGSPTQVIYSPSNVFSAIAGGHAGAVNTDWNPRLGTYKLEAFHSFTYTYTDGSGQHTVAFPPFPSLSPGDPPLSPATRYIEPMNGYDIYQTPVNLKLTVEGAEMDADGQTATITGCSAPITITAVLTPPLPPGNVAPPITWTGGLPGSDSRHRTIACASGTAAVTAAVGANLQAAVSISVNPPTITSFLPSQFQAGINPYMLTIQGTNLLGSGGVPILNFGNSGVTYTIDTHNDHEVRGWLNATNAVTGEYTVVFTPAGTSQTATAAIRVTPGAGTVTGQYPKGPVSAADRIGVWWLGTTAIDSNDECDANGATPNCYWTWVTLTVTPGPGGAPPSSTSPATWALTDPVTHLPSPLVTYTCSDTACRQITVRATAAGWGTVNVEATIDGVPSALFIVGVDYPAIAQVFIVEDTIWEEVGIPAYQSHNYMRLISASGRIMPYMPVHEEYPSPDSWQACGGSAGWTDPIPQTDPDPKRAWGKWITNKNGEFTNLDGNLAADTVGYGCTQGQCSPVSDIPGTKKNPPQALATRANAWSYHYIYVGSETTVPLGRYIAVRADKQVRYTDHGRDEVQEWSCPIQ